MTDPNRPNDDAAKAAPTGEPVVSKPYIMPDDPEEGSNEALTRELAEARDKMLRTLAEMENLRQRTRREVADSKTYGITGFARDVLDIADNLQRALDGALEPIRFRLNQNRSSSLCLTRFLHANRYPLRSKTL